MPAILKDFDGETTDEISFKMCTERDFTAPWFTETFPLLNAGAVVNHRKQWELVYLVYVIKFYNLCQPSKRGLVFAVGLESLPQLFASMGCDVVAMDLPVNDDPRFAKIWAATGQHSASVEALYKGQDFHGMTLEAFKKRVTYRPENMNNFSDWLQSQKFDFVWSLCSIEHVGSIELGMEAVLKSTDLLKPGGVAFHTVEFILTSNSVTKEMKEESIWRKQDIEKLRQHALEEKRVEVLPISFGAGVRYLDRQSTLSFL